MPLNMDTYKPWAKAAAGTAGGAFLAATIALLMLFIGTNAFGNAFEVDARLGILLILLVVAGLLTAVAGFVAMGGYGTPLGLHSAVTALAMTPLLLAVMYILTLTGEGADTGSLVGPLILFILSGVVAIVAANLHRNPQTRLAAAGLGLGSVVLLWIGAGISPGSANQAFTGAFEAATSLFPAFGLAAGGNIWHMLALVFGAAAALAAVVIPAPSNRLATRLVGGAAGTMLAVSFLIGFFSYIGNVGDTFVGGDWTFTVAGVFVLLAFIAALASACCLIAAAVTGIIPTLPATGDAPKARAKTN